MQPWLLASSLIYMDLYHFNYVLLACLVLRLNFCVIFVMTSTAISVDRLLALLLGLWYRHVVTLRHVPVVLIWFWIIDISVGSIRIWKSDIAINVVAFLLALSLVIPIVSYTRIYLKLRHQQAHIQNQVSQGQANGGTIPLSIARYKQTVSSSFWVKLALVAC